MKLKCTNLNRTAPSATVSQAVNSPKIAKAEMFSFHSKYFVYREMKRAPQKLSFCFKWPDTGTKPPITSVPLGQELMFLIRFFFCVCQ